MHYFDITFKHAVFFVSGGSSLASVVAGSKPTKPWDKPQFPQFGDNIPRNVTAIVGQTAELNCYVKYQGGRVVSNIFTLHSPRAYCFLFSRVREDEGDARERISVAPISLDFFQQSPCGFARR